MVDYNVEDKFTKENVFLISKVFDLEKIAKIIADKLDCNTFILLVGDLGSGKTTLTKFISKELGIIENINSPTFNILKRYWIPSKKCFLNHFDFFRLKQNEDISFFDDIKLDNINIIEWPYVNKFFWEHEKKLINVSIRIRPHDAIRELTLNF